MIKRLNVVLAVGCVVMAVILAGIFLSGGFDVFKSRSSASYDTSSMTDKAKEKKERQEASEFTVEDASGTKYTTGGVNVRSGPAISYSTLIALSSGQEVTVTGKVTMSDGDWYRVVINGATGYILGTYLSDTAPVSDEDTAAINTSTNAKSSKKSSSQNAGNTSSQNSNNLNNSDNGSGGAAGGNTEGSTSGGEGGSSSDGNGAWNDL